MAPLLNPTAIGALVGYGLMDEISQYRDEGGDVSLVYHPVRKTMEECKSTVDLRGSSNTEDGRSWRQLPG